MILGIDPSLSGTALCFYENNKYEFNLIGTVKNKKLPQSVDYTIRLMDLRDRVRNEINGKKIKIAAIEGISFGSVGRLAELGSLSYFIKEVLIEHKIPFIVIPPTVLKKYWTGKGNCGKEEMIDVAIKNKIDIPFTKKYKGKILPDDNCVDSAAIVNFVKDFLDDKLKEYEERVERYEP